MDSKATSCSGEKLLTGGFFNCDFSEILTNDRSIFFLTFCNAKSIMSICTKGEHYEKDGTSKRR